MGFAVPSDANAVLYASAILEAASGDRDVDQFAVTMGLNEIG